MARISVTARSVSLFEVSVVEGGTTTTHSVSADQATIDHLAAGRSAEAVIEASFRFLLDREPKESILSAFDLQVIGRYFPEYEDRLGSYLAAD